MPDYDFTIRAACVHKSDDVDARHTVPTIIDFAFGRVLWRVTRRLQRFTGIRAADLAIRLALIGAVFEPIDALTRHRDLIDFFLLPFDATPGLFVALVAYGMRNLHRHLEDGGDPDLGDIGMLSLARTTRLLSLVFLGMCITPPVYASETIGFLAFIVFPAYACAVGGKPKSKLRDRASEASRRLREMLAGLRPRPALGGAGA